MSSEFFANKTCGYYPCHELGDINCLFCFCPLYGESDCKGYYIVMESGKKDCSQCLFPHHYNNYEHVVERLKD